MSDAWLRTGSLAKVDSVTLTAKASDVFEVTRGDIDRGAIVRLDGHDYIVPEPLPCGSQFTVVGGSIVRVPS